MDNIELKWGHFTLCEDDTARFFRKLCMFNRSMVVSLL